MGGGGPRLEQPRLPRAHLEPGRASGNPVQEERSPKNEAPVACPDWVYNNRNQVERLWARLKEWRAIATRYEKTASSFMGVLCLAAALDWIKP
jgi:Transposase DDE domain